ncbi:hypothetical protein FXO38_09918 [Capsicum annuum]|uniref:Glucan endo-1,3-beta-D-glucosidase n=1 Tax=Capsicum annuum TaxID=4072 RepID=A0A2G2ZNU5_CAPAN|nr:hypothetical protein FXO38_09918 [Capsicum annuum]PHT83643.1 hypothetical protein T459_12086 [Capsicum annuum]
MTLLLWPGQDEMAKCFNLNDTGSPAWAVTDLNVQRMARLFTMMMAFLPNTRIVSIAVGNEVLGGSDNEPEACKARYEELRKRYLDARRGGSRISNLWVAKGFFPTTKLFLGLVMGSTY